MYANEQRKRLFSSISNVMLWLVEVISFSLVWFNEYDIRYKSHFYKYGHVAVIGMYAVFIYLITKSFNGYKISYMRVVDLTLSHVLSSFLANIAGYIFICMVWTDYMTMTPMILLSVGQMVFCGVWVKLTRQIFIHIFPPRRVIIIYGNYPLEHFLEKLTTRNDKYEVSEILNYQKGMERICSDVLDFEGVFLYDLPAEERNSIMKYCYEHDIRTYVVPKITDIIMRGSDDLHLVDTPLFLSRNQGLHVDQRFIKRFVDIVVSTIGIIVASPIMLIIAICIKAYDRGPVFYRQERLTRGGERFMIFKFRSMKMNAEEQGAQLAKKDDDRVTPIGKVLRNLHLDELPQLFNVFVGDMSIVGPRPERPEIFEKYKESIPDFGFRLKVKAGITGYAQVYGKYNTTPIDKLKMDLMYIQEYSFGMDIKLMLLTFRIIFKKETSEGVRAEQITALNEEDDQK